MPMMLVAQKFEGQWITTICLGEDCRLAWFAREVGRALGFGNDGEDLVTFLGGCRASLTEGADYETLAGDDLATLRRSLYGTAREACPDGETIGVLREAGLHLACSLAFACAPTEARRKRVLALRDLLLGSVKRVPRPQLNERAVATLHRCVRAVTLSDVAKAARAQGIVTEVECLAMLVDAASIAAGVDAGPKDDQAAA